MDVKFSGPIFDGTASKVIQNYCTEMERDVAEEGVQMIQSQLGSVLKHPTGNYRRHIAVMEHGDSAIITDSGVVYGPWLEGTGSRNARSRFKGYSTFRKIGQRLAEIATNKAEAVLGQYIGKIQ